MEPFVLGKMKGIAHYVSTADFDPISLPGPQDVLPGEEYKVRQTQLLKVAAETFKDLLK